MQRGSAAPKPQSWLSFGVFQVDLRSGELRKNGAKIRIQQKPVRLLEVLLEHPGEVVTREELREKLWPADTFVDFDHSLGTAIGKLRQALGDSAQNPRFIETLPGRGYRFIAPATVANPVDAPRQVAPTAFRLWISRFPVLLTLVLTTASVGLFAYLVTRRFGTANQRGKVMMAVLPFENLTGDPAQDFVSDGFTEETITDLGSLNPPQLGVIARTSAMAYKGTNKPVDRIARELGVDYILEGSLRRWADKVRISAQLIRTRDQTHLWAREYESDRPDILRLQSEVAQDVVRQISLTVTLFPQKAATVPAPIDPQVYEFCLMGRYEWNKRNEEGLTRALDYFQKAIDRAPGYAPAYAGLADTYMVLPYYGGRPQAEMFRSARLAAERALQLDETLPEAHTTLGLVHTANFELQLAEKEFERALALNPNYSTAHHWYAFLLWTTDRQPDALAHIERARQLDPLSLIINADEGKLLCAAGHCERAIPLLERALELDANFTQAHRTLAVAYVQGGRLADAMAEAQRAVTLDPDGPQSVVTLGYVSARAGRVGIAQRAIAELQPRVESGSLSPFFVAMIYAGLKDKEQTTLWLNKAVAAKRGRGIDMVEAAPIFDSLGSDSGLNLLLDQLRQVSRHSELAPGKSEPGK